MTNKSIKLGLAKVSFYSEPGNMYVKNKDMESKPIKYGAYIGHEEPLNLRAYMSLKQLSLLDASKELVDSGAVLLGSTFNIHFYDKDSVEKFISVASNK